MAVVVYFPPDDMTVAQYDGLNEDMRAAGPYPAAGLLSHVCFTDGGKLSICDVWDDEANFKAFAQMMMPLAAKAGISLPEPFISPVHNYIIREPART